MCTRPITIRVLSDSYWHHKGEEIQVPCGKCRECMNKRKNSLAYRCYRQALNMPNVWFLTLTYNNNTLPIARSLYKVRKSDGEILPVGKYELISRLEYYNNQVVRRFHAGYKSFKIRHTSGKSMVCPYPFYYDHKLNGIGDLIDDFEYYLRLTPSVSRYDVRIWIKNFRERWFKSTGERLDFKYSCCFEYGPKSFRPHAHILVFGLADDVVKLLCKDWAETFGHVYKEKVKALNEDGSSGYLKVSKYLAKYMSKGKSCECPSAISGFCECPRLLNSLHLGDTLTDSELAYFRCYDLFGRYDLDRLTYLPVEKNSRGFQVSKKLSEEHINMLIEEIPKRLVVSLSEKYNIRLPKYFIDKVFGYVDCEKKIKRTTIWHLVAQSVQDRISSELEKEFTSFLGSRACLEDVKAGKYDSGYLNDVCSEFEYCRQMAVAERERVEEKAYILSLSKSIF